MIKGNHFFLKANDSVFNVINNINNSQYQICFIVDDQGSLIGSIADGDIRRGLIEGHSIDSCVDNVDAALADDQSRAVLAHHQNKTVRGVASPRHPPQIDR